MKTPLLLMSALTLIAVCVSAADANLNQSITVERPLDDVIAAMQTYYFGTNPDYGFEAVCGTNSVPGVSYTFKIMDCAFDRGVGLFDGKMIATRISTNSTRLELLSNAPTPQDSDAVTSLKHGMSRALEHVAKIAENNR